ncbi:MaoC family dehydratase [Sphingopyxis terrae]|uniref:MaoC family dehydratase n=1 Tax=Sphingopyxis terrae TaxID=33052 RepID=UPI002A11C182|nr:MaoC family dehydratase [Sphingopyxis terrae]MDX8356437.1 MaoC family dehydratase [Sphingopyxis terrae]
MESYLLDHREHRFVTIDELRSMIGRETGVSSWFRITQSHIDAFANISGDFQYIHTDPEAAARTNFGSTIAHGFFTLTLLGHLGKGPRPRVHDVSHSVNYGFDRVRFVTPVPCGSNVRARFTLARLDERDKDLTAHWDCVMEVEGFTKPAIIAKWIWRAFRS